MENITIRKVNPDKPELLKLISELDKYLIKMYPKRKVFGINLEKENTDKLIFLLACFDNNPAGCGALRLIDDNTCELKRMFITDKFRGLGISKVIYYELEKYALKCNRNKIILETGYKQLEAIKLYESLGFSKIPKYGDFIDDEVSICLGKKLIDL